MCLSILGSGKITCKSEEVSVNTANLRNEPCSVWLQSEVLGESDGGGLDEPRGVGRGWVMNELNSRDKFVGGRFSFGRQEKVTFNIN